MADAIAFPEADAVEDYETPAASRPLPVKTFKDHTVSCWKLDDLELAEVARTGTLWLTTQTFKSLAARSDGERYQPPVSLTANREIALGGWDRGEARLASASDRIVTFADNQIAFEEARTALDAVAVQFRLGNDVGNMSAADVEEAQRELMILQHAFACNAIRTGWIAEPAIKCLRWIASKAAGAVVGKLAEHALAVVLRHFA